MKIPVYLNNFNRLTPVQRMVADLARMNARVRIIDNASTYPPLLEWYEHDCPVEVIYPQQNLGPRAAWHPGVMEPLPVGALYCCCDADLDLSRCPDDLLSLLAAGLARYPDICKVGPGIEINDIPDASPFAQRIREVEGTHWQRRRDDYFFEASIDTAFAMYRTGDNACIYGPALRADRPYVVRHLPYYLTPGNVTDEERYYVESVPQGIKGGLYWTTLFQDNPESMK